MAWGVVLLADRGASSGAPVFVQFQADAAGGDLFSERFRQAGVALAEEAQVHGERIRRFQHARHVPGAGGDGGGVGAGGGAGAAADHGGDAGGQRLVDLLRADKVNVGIDATGGDDAALARHHIGAGADDNIHVGLHVRVTGLADGGDAPGLDADVRLDDAPVIDDQGIGDDQIHDFGRGMLRLAHAIADDLAAAEFHFVAVDGVVLFHLDPQIGIGEAQAVAGGGAEHFRVGLSGHCCHGGSPVFARASFKARRNFYP